MRSTVLNPAVRGVTEAKKLVTIFPMAVGCCLSDASDSRIPYAKKPTTNRIIVVVSANLELVWSTFA